MRNHRLLLVLSLGLMVTACFKKPAAVMNDVPSLESKPSPQPMLDAPEITVVEFLKGQDQAKTENQSPLLKTWKREPGWKNYRIARSTDFRIPEWVEKEVYAKEVERATNDAYARGEMSGAHGLAVIIIDKTISSAQRFGCVVFISRPGNRNDLYWIFKNEDLSRFTMGTHSGDIYLEEYRYDRSTRVCDIQYNSKQKRWACEFY